jgi:rRNA maturation RNase YbeY
MDIQITWQRRIPGLGSPKIRQRLKKVLNDLGCRDGELSILFTDDRQMATLNRTYRGRNGSTNVLAFPMENGITPNMTSRMLGDIVVSVDTALAQSQESGKSVEETIYQLLIHGLLHLLDYDHERSTADADRMEKEQARLLAMMLEGW